MSEIFVKGKNCEMCNANINCDNDGNYLCTSCGIIGNSISNDDRKKHILQLFNKCHLNCLMIHSCFSINHDVSHYKFLNSDEGVVQKKAFDSLENIFSQLTAAEKTIAELRSVNLGLSSQLLKNDEYDQFQRDLLNKTIAEKDARIIQLEQQFKEAEEVIEFYAHWINWKRRHKTPDEVFIQVDDTYMNEKGTMTGGKKARAYLSKRNKGE